MIVWVLVLQVLGICNILKTLSRRFSALLQPRCHFVAENGQNAIGTLRDFAGRMARIQSHTELVCWQLADQLRQLLIKHTDIGTSAAADWRFTANIRDAIASACRNQSEGFYKFRHRQMKPFFNTARGSLGEIEDGITDGLERRYFTEDAAREMQRLCKRAVLANLRFLQSLDRPDPE